MDKVRIIKKLNRTIAELEEIRNEIISEYPDWLNDMTLDQLLEGKASVRLLNVIKQEEIGNTSVMTFVQKVKRIDMLKFRNFGKFKLIELSGIIKKETGIDW